MAPMDFPEADKPMPLETDANLAVLSRVRIRPAASYVLRKRAPYVAAGAHAMLPGVATRIERWCAPEDTII